MRIAAVVLAAGSARRFGSDKRRHPIDGVAMLSRTLTVYRQALDEVAAVIRPGERDVAELVSLAGCRVVEAADAAAGQSRSLAAGVAAFSAQTSPRVDGLLVGLGDMPCVSVETLRSLVAAMIENPDVVVRPRCAGHPGNPIGFPRHLFDALTRIEGDTGARQIVAARDDVLFIDVDDPGILQDVDRPG